MLQQLERGYRLAMPFVVGAYVIAVATMVVIFNSVSMGQLDRAGLAALAICAAAIPLEELSDRFRRLRASLVVLYLAAFAVGFFLLNVRLSVEWVVLILIGAALISGKIKPFLRDWAAFIVVLVAWQITDGLAGAFHFPLHIRPMIDADKIIGGGVVPAVWLQEHLFNPKQVSWLDILGVIVYSFHFLLPLTAGFILWLVNRHLYYRYAIAFTVAAMLGFATYIVYPAVPPWLAVMHCPNPNGSWACAPGRHHFLPWVYNSVTGKWSPSIHDVWNHTMAGWLSKNNGNVAFGPFHLGFDQVGAIPSEHVMYPALVFLFFRKQFGRIGYLMVPYIALVMFVIVYMGQHYVVDGIIGIAYAVVVYALVMHLAPFVLHRLRHKTVPLPVAIPAAVPDPWHEDDLVPAGSAAERRGH